MRGIGGLWWSLLLVGLASCGTSVRLLPVVGPPGGSLCCTHGDEEITVQYLGVGGWLFRMGDAVLLTAPFYSNPGLVEVGVAQVEADTLAIERHLPAVDDVDGIVVGHAHYDHLMDVPYIVRRRAPEATVYGSRTAVNLLMGDPELSPDRLVSVEEVAGDHERAGEWIHMAGGRIRIMALRSTHAPHLLGISFFEGQVEEPLDALPDRAAGWLAGTPLAYLIDFLSRDGEVVYRVHYQDAASAPPFGFPPPLDDGIPVDLAIVCPPGYEEVPSYPEGILERLDPSWVLLGHWEDFFRPRTEDLQGVPGTDLDTFIERMEAVLPAEAGWRLLEPETILRIPPS